MRMAALMLLILAACASPTTDTTLTTVDVGISGAVVVPADYLVEISNLNSDFLAELSRLPETFSTENPQPSTEEEISEFLRGYGQGVIDIAFAYADRLADASAPEILKPAHDRHVRAIRTLFDEVESLLEEAQNLEDLDAVLSPFFSESPTYRPPMRDLFNEWTDSCRGLEEAATRAGYQLVMECPQLPVESTEVTVTVSIGDSWTATPDVLPSGHIDVWLTVTNTGSDAVHPVVLEIFEGEPLDLPIRNGRVDVTRSMTLDPQSSYAYFGLMYPDELLVTEGVTIGDAPPLEPGESFEIGSSGPSSSYVVFDYRPGEFEAGTYVVIRGG